MQSTPATTRPDEIRVETAGAGDSARWDDYVVRHPHASFYHLSGWRRAIESTFGRQVFYLWARAGSDIVGVLPVVRLKSLAFGDFLISIPYVNFGGVLAESTTVNQVLVDACEEIARDLGVRHVELRHTSDELDLPVRTDRICMRLDLPDDPGILWKQIKAKLRSQIRRPIREGAEFIAGGVELLPEFYPIFASKYRDLGVPVYPEAWFRAIFREFPENSEVHVVRISGKTAAAGIVFRFKETSEVAWAASVREADRIGANMFLYWNMLEQAINAGSRVFDFGRTTEGSGTHRFKKQWGTYPVQLYWHYILVTASDIPKLNLDNPRYNLAATIWRKLPLAVANRVGPVLVKNLP